MYHYANISPKSNAGVTLAAIAPGLAVARPSLNELFAEQVAEAIDPGSAVVWQGDPSQYVVEIVSGAVRTVRALSDGRRVITGFLFAGDVFGASLGERYPVTVEAIVPTRVRRIARRRFADDLARRPELTGELMAKLRAEMMAAQEQVVLLARKTAEERVASFLLSLARRAGNEGDADAVIALPMTRLDMADYLGLTIETVSRIMTRLAGRGVIAAAGRHGIIIRRPRALATLALDDGEDGCLEDRDAA